MTEEAWLHLPPQAGLTEEEWHIRGDHGSSGISWRTQWLGVGE